MYFLALSHAPPPDVIEIATNIPVIIEPTSNPPSILAAASSPKPLPIKTIAIGATIGSSAGIIISLMAALVTISTHLPYSGLAWPVIMPFISLNWRRTSSTTEVAALPTASIQKAPKIYGNNPPINKPTKTYGSDNVKSTTKPPLAFTSSWVNAENNTTAANPAEAMA